jgi:tRNA dimethylallyltransferase
MMPSKLIVVLGPTATGKSDLAVRLAKDFNGEVISADSRQVYKGLDIGTGKITKKEMCGIPHHLLNVVDPKKVFSVTSYQKHASRATKDILKHGKIPIVCGGTGLYIAALVDGIVFPDVPPNTALRKELASRSAEELFSMLTKLDPERAKTIDQHNPRRLVRAIEIATAQGKNTPLQIHAPYAAIKIGLDLPDEELKKKILKRIRGRLKKGMAAEAKRLHKQGLSWKRMETFGLEYRLLAQHLQGKISKEVFVEELAKEIWQYVRRQRTWFHRDTSIAWFTPTQYAKLRSYIRAQLRV